MIKALGGTLSPHFTQEVRALIANEVGSEKYRVAVSLGIPILRATWVSDCLRYYETASSASSSSVTTHFNPVSEIRNYTLLALAGAKICITGLDGVSRQEITTLIPKLGGQYCADLTKECTHLIAAQASGKKFEFGLKWNIQIVNEKWIHDCARAGCCLTDDIYSVLPAIRPTDSLCDTTIDGPTSIDKVNWELIFESMPEADICLFDKMIVYATSDLLANSHVALGVRKILRACGGTMSKVISPQITHILCIKNDDQDERTVADCPVISCLWLIHSFMRQTILPLDEYFVSTQPAEKLEDFDIDVVKRTQTVQDSIAEESIVLRHSASSTSGISSALKLGEESSISFTSARSNSFSDDASKVARAKSLDESKLGIFCPRGKPLIISCIKFLPNEARLIEKIVKEEGGTFVEFSTSRLSLPTPSFIIAPLIPLAESTEFSTLDQGQLVTEYWLERCLESRLLIPIESCLAFRPVSTLTRADAGRGVIISISGYDGIEWSYLGKICKKLGAEVTERFSRKNTHLVALNKSSQKAIKAAQWGIPIYDSSWVYQCLANGSFDLQTSLKPLAQLSPVYRRNVPDTSVREVAQVKAAVIAEYSPKPFATKKPDTPLAVAVSRNLSKALQNVTVDISNRHAHKDDQASAVSSSPVTNNPVLKGVVICVSERLSHRKDDIYRLASSLGAKVSLRLENECTHYVHQSVREVETFKDFKLAVRKGCFVVSPHWLKECRKQSRRMGESHYPHTFDPTKAVDGIDASASIMPTPSLSFSAEIPEKPEAPASSPMPTVEGYCDASDANIAGSTSLDISIMSAMDDFIGSDLPITEENRPFSFLKGRPSSTVPSVKLAQIECPVKDISLRDDEESAATFFAPHAGDSAPQPHYQDPAERREKNKLIEQLDSNRKRKRDKVTFSIDETESAQLPEPSLSMLPCNIPVAAEPVIATICEINVVCPPRILLSGISAEARVSLKSSIAGLGGILIESEAFDSSCTHLITGKPSRNEKCLAAIARGCWILKASFITASKAAGAFVAEEPHEWDIPSPGSKQAKIDVQLISAIRRWRLKLGNYLKTPIGASVSEGSFCGWKVFLLAEKKKEASFQRVLMAGKASVLVKSGSSAADFDDISHILIDTSKVSAYPSLVASNPNALFLDTSFIGEYLFDEKGADASKHSAEFTKKLNSQVRKG